MQGSHATRVACFHTAPQLALGAAAAQAPLRTLTARSQHARARLLHQNNKWWVPAQRTQLSHQAGPGPLGLPRAGGHTSTFWRAQPYSIWICSGGLSCKELAR